MEEKHLSNFILNLACPSISYVTWRDKELAFMADSLGLGHLDLSADAVCLFVGIAKDRWKI